MLTTEQECLKRDITAKVEHLGNDRRNLILILQEIQKSNLQISDFTMQVIADCLNIQPAEVYGVVSFYPFLSIKPRGQFLIRLCRNIACEMASKDALARKLENSLGITFGQTTDDGLFTLEWTNCLGLCDQGPALLVNEKVYTKVTPNIVDEIIQTYRKTEGQNTAESYTSKIITISPSYVTTSLFSPVIAGRQLITALSEPREELISKISTVLTDALSNSDKWDSIAIAIDDNKCVVCSADEYGPSCFNDRTVLGEYTDLVIEGMIISGYAVDAKKGIVYLRNQYAYLQPIIESKLTEYRQQRLLGSNIIVKSGFSFDIEVRIGSGSFTFGERSSLIESLLGYRGEPNTYPLTMEGTQCNNHFIVDNAETFARIPRYCTANTLDHSAGSTLISVSGDCSHPGVYEFPLGFTISEVLNIVGGTDAKAVLIGGVSGQCIPASEFNQPITNEGMSFSNAVIVFGPKRNMLKVARNILEFFTSESCGQCTPCREGSAKLLDSVNRSLGHACSKGYLMDLCSLAETMQLASKCNLGQSAPNAFLSIIKHYPNG